MSRLNDRKQRRERIKRRYRGVVRGTSDRPRLTVFRSLRYVYAQVIDDDRGVTLVSASTLDKAAAGDLKSTANLTAGKRLGTVIAERAKDQGISTVVFDRGGFKFHGVIRAIADGAREAGLKF
jgi:large subunit ribosomal protein L18